MIRVQRRRTRGWRMREGTVYVGRLSRWGSPWRIGDPTPEQLRARWHPALPAVVDDRAAAVHFQVTIRQRLVDDPAWLERRRRP